MASAAPLDIPITRQAIERRVYTWAAIVALIVIFAGFAPTYYLKGAFGGPDLSTVKHVHGVVMTAWFVFFFVQVRLVATGNTLTHRKMGVFGVVLALALVTVGMMSSS